MAVYRIKNWDEHFENHESRKLKALKWVSMPNRHDGKGYRRIAVHPAGVEVFCAWHLIVQVASRMPVRGVLRDEDGALDAVDLAAKTGFPAHIFETAFDVLTHPKIGWLELLADDALPKFDSISGESSPTPGAPPTWYITEQYKTGEGTKHPHLRAEPSGDDSGAADCGGGEDGAPLLVFPCVPGRRTKEREWALTEAFADELGATYPAVNVLQVCRELWQWVRANPSRRKTARGMPEFLNRNLAKRQNRGSYATAGGGGAFTAGRGGHQGAYPSRAQGGGRAGVLRARSYDHYPDET